MLDPETWSDFAATRRSVRDFRPDPIPDEVLSAILADALTAPSWSNTQPYRLAVASGHRADRLRQELTGLFDESAPLRRAGAARRLWAGVSRRGLPDSDFDVPRTYPAELQDRRRRTGFALYEALGIRRDDHQARDRQMRRNFEFFGAPTVVFAFVHEGLGVYSVLDAGFLLQNLLLAAHVRGIGSCAQGALAIWADPVREEFDVPPRYRLLCGVSLGYASDAPVNAFAPARPDVAEILLDGR